METNYQNKAVFSGVGHSDTGTYQDAFVPIVTDEAETKKSEPEPDVKPRKLTQEQRLAILEEDVKSLRGALNKVRRRVNTK